VRRPPGRHTRELPALLLPSLELLLPKPGALDMQDLPDVLRDTPAEPLVGTSVLLLRLLAPADVCFDAELLFILLGDRELLVRRLRDSDAHRGTLRDAHAASVCSAAAAAAAAVVLPAAPPAGAAPAPLPGSLVGCRR
jgi:hypothetical protein